MSIESINVATTLAKYVDTKQSLKTSNQQSEASPQKLKLEDVKDKNNSHLNLDISELLNAEAAEKRNDIELDKEQMEQVAQYLQDSVGKLNKGLAFSVHEESGKDVVQVMDKRSGEVIKQYPSEDILNVIAKLSKVTGMFFDETI